MILANAANTFSGGINSTGNLQVGSGAAAGSLGTGVVTNTGVLSFNSSSNMTIATAIAGSGNIVQNGTGVLTLSGANTYSGSTAINAGTVRYGTTTGLSAGNVNIAAGAKLDVNGLAVVINNVTGSGVIDNALAASNATITFGGASVSFGGTIQNTGGSLAIVKAGTGTLTLSGNNTYSGGTTANATILAAGSNTAFGSGPITLNATGAQLTLAAGLTLSNPITINNGTTTEFLDIPSGASATYAGNSTIQSTASQYRLGLSNSASTLTVTGTNNSGGTTTIITRGNIVFAGNGSLTSTNSINISRQSNTTTANVTVQDNGFIRGNGINLGGINGTSDGSFTNVIVSGNGLMDAGTGVFSLNNSGTNGSVTLTMSGNSSVRGSAFQVTGSKVAGGTVWEIDGGKITASANNTNFMPASSALTVFLGGPLTIDDGGFNISVGQPFADAGGSVTKVGTGSVAFTAASNGYSGTTTVNAGAFYSNAAGATGSGAVVGAAGATVGGTGSITGAVTVSGHLAPGAGATVGTLTPLERRADDEQRFDAGY